MTESYETARKMFLEKENELERVKESHMKDMEKEGLDRLKLEDSVRALTLSNERLKVKDDTYFNMFDCMNQFMESKGFKISKVGEVQDVHVIQGGKQSPESNDKKKAERTTVMYVCDECDQETTSKHDLESHKDEVHRANYECNVCTFKTKMKTDFLKH